MPDAVIAALLAQRFRELRSLVALYTAAIQPIGADHDIPVRGHAFLRVLLEDG